MPLERLIDRTEAPPEAADLYTTIQFQSPPLHRPTIVLNMVATLDGRTAITPGGWSTAIGSTTDRLLMRRIRMACPAVAVGAATLRSGPTGFPQHLLRVIFSRTGEIPEDHQAFQAGRERCLLFTPSENRAALAGQLGHLATVIGVPDDSAIPSALAVLRQQYGIATLLLEGGPTLNGAFLAAGCIDEVFLSVAPLISGRSGLPGIFECERPAISPLCLDIVSAYGCEGEIYLRYRVTAPTGAPTKESLP